jgi:hypothetical protein
LNGQQVFYLLENGPVYLSLQDILFKPLMDDEFYIPVLYKGGEVNFPARLIPSGYVYKIEVTVADSLLLYEKDDEGAWRALIDPENVPRQIDVGLLKAIALSIEEILA